MKFTVERFLKEPHCRVCKEMIVMVSSVYASKNRGDEAGIALGKQDWFKKLYPQFSGIGLTPSSEYMRMRELQNDYRTETQNGKEPEWLSYLSRAQVTELRWNYWISECDPIGIVPSIPHAGIGYIVRQNGLFNKVADLFHLHRLSSIKQLGLLHDPMVRSKDFQGFGSFYEQTRWCHSLDVAVLCMLIGQNCNLSESDLTHLIVAGISHDALTPALGDTTKGIDPEAFDEDAHYRELFLLPGWAEFRDTFSLNEDLLHDIIMNKGVLGQLLNWADKIAYVARDTEAFIPSNKNLRFADIPAEFRKIEEMIESDPLVCSLWETIEIVDGKVTFSDPERLARFLKLRAYMFRMLYYNPASRFLEDALGKIILRHLYRKGELTRAMLLQMGDMQLLVMIDRTVGRSYAFSSISEYQPRVFKFKTEHSARVVEKELSKDDELMTWFDESRLGHSTNFSKFFVNINGSAVPFDKACPELTTTIGRVVECSEPFLVYVFSLKELRFPSDLIQGLREERHERLFGKEE